MRQIVKDVIDYVTTQKTPVLLQPAVAQWGAQEVRLFCINLAGWWARRTLMQSRHPYLPMPPVHPWQVSFRGFVGAIPELQALTRFDDFACHFSDAVTLDERRAINEYAQANYRPMVFVDYAPPGRATGGA